MKVLVTGASGFIGQNLLLGIPRDWEVVATYRSDYGFSTFLNVNSLHNVTAYQVDLCDPISAAKFSANFPHFDACVYLAANGDPALSVRDPLKDLQDNTLGLVNLLHHTEIDKMVYFSSGAVYDGLQGNVNPSSWVAPTLPYAISKWASERYVMHAQKLGRIKTASIVRFFGAYGPYEPERKIYGKLVKTFAIKKIPEFTLTGNGENLIDAMHVSDTIRAILLVLKTSDENKVFDLYSGAPLKLKDLVKVAAQTFGLDVKINYVGAVPEFIEFRSVDQYANTKLGFTPLVSLEEGLRSFHTWIASRQ